ncbi:MAG TPA: hypothetical protein VGM90_31595 [Kofleriaceae bacterium]
MLVSLAVVMMTIGTANAYVVNYAEHEINLQLVYIGAVPAKRAGNENLDFIYAKTAEDDRGAMEQLAVDEGPEHAQYFPLRPQKLGEVRGFHFRLHLFAPPSGPKYAKARAMVIGRADGIVLVLDASPASESANKRVVAELAKALTRNGKKLADAKLFVQVLGSDRSDDLTEADVLAQVGLAGRPSFLAYPVEGIGVFDALLATSKLVIEGIDMEKIAKSAR